MVRPAGVCIGSLFLLLLSMFAIMQFFALGCREKNLIFHAAMVNQVVFAAYQVVKHAVEHIVVFQLIVSDHDVFELGETLGHVGVVAAIFLQTEISRVFTGYEPLYIWKDVVVFKLHVFADLFHIIVVIFDYEECHVGDFCAIDGFYELLADLRQVEVEEITRIIRLLSSITSRSLSLGRYSFKFCIRSEYACLRYGRKITKSQPLRQYSFLSIFRFGGDCTNGS